METTDTQDANMKRTMTYLMMGLFATFLGIILLANSLV